MKSYKTAKADVVWPRFRPSGIWIENPNAYHYPECGGNVTITAEAVAGMYFGEIELDIESVCSRCKQSYHALTELLDDMRVSGKLDLVKIAEHLI